MPSNWLLFDRLRALARQHRIYQAERVYQDESDLDKLAPGGQLDIDQQSSILDQTNLQINRLERYKDYEQMDQTGEISLALDLYCLAPNTKIPLLDGTCPTIAELAASGKKQFWMYGYDAETGQLKPVLGRDPHVSGRNAELVRVRWDGGYIDCTPSHKFHTKRGWVPAGELKTGDSLTPVNLIRHCISPSNADHRVAQSIRKGYEAIQCGSVWKLTHRWVYEYFNGGISCGNVIYHKDVRRKNNEPTNLEEMSWNDHKKLHEKIGRLPAEVEKQRRESVSKAIKRKWQDPAYKEKLIPHCRQRGLDLSASGKAFRGGSKPTSNWEQVCLIAIDIGVEITHAKLAKTANISRATLDRMLKRANIDWPHFKAKYCGIPVIQSIGNIDERIVRFGASMMRMGLDPHNWDENRNLVASDPQQVPTLSKVIERFGSIDRSCSVIGYNHTVISIEKLSEIAEEVYDLYVDDGHAFAAGTESSWVIVHNSDEASLIDPERKHTLIIRARNKRLKKSLEELFFGTLQWDTYCRPTVRYLCKYGDMPYEVVLDKNRNGVSSLRFMNVYNFTRIETRYGDLVGFFYMDAMWPKPQFFHPWQVMHMRLTSFENIYHPYGRCVKGCTLISTPQGPVAIKDLQINDAVYSWDDKEKKAVQTKIVAKACNGNKKLIKVKTLHHEIECTAEHPILIDGYGYKQAQDLKIGDRVIVPKTTTINCPIKLQLSNPTNGNCIIPRLPYYLDIEFARLFGFLIGDGWVSGQSVCFALGEHIDINQRYIDIIENYGLHCTERCDNDGKPIAISCSNMLLAELIGRMGLVGKADNKNIPNWVFASTRDIQLAFLQGYVDADGCYREDNGICLTSCNSGLLRQFRYLLKSLDYKCGTISGPFRNNSELCDSDRDLKRYAIVYYPKYRQSNCLTDVEALTEAVAVNTSYAGVLRSLGYKPHGSMYELLKQRINDYSIDISHFKGMAWNKGGAATAVLDSPLITNTEMNYITERILSVKMTDEIDEVYDIQVDGYHNFIADGIVIHNSILDGGRKAFKQLRLMEDAALIYRITRAPEKRKFIIPVGNIPAKEIPEYMQMIARNFKRQRFYNPTTGTFDERYSPLIQEDDFFLPRRTDGTGPEIDILPGAENLDQIADITYFKKKMVAPLKIPFARVGIGDGAGEASEKSLSQSHAEFAKSVQWVQREVSTGLTKVAIIHLALQGFTVEDLRGFEVALTASSAMEELYRIETWQTRVGVIADLKDIGWFPKEWIVTHFTDLSPDEIEELKDMEETASQGGPGGGVAGGLDVGGEEPPPPPPNGEAPVEGEDVEPESDDQTLLSGYDYHSERRILLEMIKSGNRSAATELVYKWADRLGKDCSEFREFRSGFEYMLESKELDGLSKDQVSSYENNGIHNPNNDRGLLIEWSVNPDERDDVINEVCDLITDGLGIIEDVSDDEITEHDLPVVVSGL